ncbi:MAG: hypothetical protein ACI9XR_002709, partial [Flavobacterium sp.]
MGSDFGFRVSDCWLLFNIQNTKNYFFSAILNFALLARLFILI